MAISEKAANNTKVKLNMKNLIKKEKNQNFEIQVDIFVNQEPLFAHVRPDKNTHIEISQTTNPTVKSWPMLTMALADSSPM